MVLQSLSTSGIEIVECGYLAGSHGSREDSTLYGDISDIATHTKNKNQSYVVMINHGDYTVDKLVPRNETAIDGVRLAFHQESIVSALEDAKSIIDLGYALYLQPMVAKNYSDAEFLSLIQSANKLGVKAFYIVDSFGSMLPSEFEHLMHLVDDTLDEDIALGYHSHNNMQLAFSNAIALCNAGLGREVIIDASIYGMGRGAGNLNTELIADYLNHAMGKSYDTLPLLEVIDEFLSSLMMENPWGFSPAQYLSAFYNCHPSYAKYLIDKNTNHIVGVRKVLENIPKEKRQTYDAALIEKLYTASLLEPKSDCLGEWCIEAGKKVLLVASGSSMERYYAWIEEHIGDESVVAIALNHKPAFVCDYYFFSNQKRLNEFEDILPMEKVIVTNNIETTQKPKAIIDLGEYAFVDQVFVKNVAIVAMNFLLGQGIHACDIAGLDGYNTMGENYSYDETSVILDPGAMREENDLLRFALEKLSSRMSISFVTPSLFSGDIILRILGVIPARYKSSRFEGKPLCLIKEIPMIKRTYMQAKRSILLTDLVVATDSIEIERYCLSEDIPVVMTSENCLTGTDRLAEVASRYSYDLYVNIQGDEPVIDPEAIDEVVTLFQKYGQQYVAYNLYKEITIEEEIDSDTIIKVITNEKDELLYMSRLPVPFSKSENTPAFKKQVCVYGFTRQALALFSSREKTHNEQHEDIEILRFLDMGYKVKMGETIRDSIAVDVPSDVKKVEAYLNEKGLV